MALTYTVTGTDDGPFPGPLGPTGKEIKVRGMQIGLRGRHHDPAGTCRGVRITQGIAAGLAAGAAGTSALNAATYLDMVARGRPTSSTPEDTTEKLAAGLGVGAALGMVRSLGLRPPVVIAGVLAGAAAMAATDAPMAALDVTDPRTWADADWLSDALPHLAYGLVTAAVLQGLDDARVSP